MVDREKQLQTLLKFAEGVINATCEMMGVTEQDPAASLQYAIAHIVSRIKRGLAELIVEQNTEHLSLAQQLEFAMFLAEAEPDFEGQFEKALGRLREGK